MNGEVRAEADELDRLASAAAAGDEASLNELLGRVQNRVRARCRRIFPNSFDADDAAQDALLVVARRISTFEGRSRFTTWLYQVASRSALDSYRKMQRHALEGAPLPEDRVATERTSVLAGAHVDLLDGLASIDDTYRDAVMLRDVCQLDYGEIASALDVPVGTAKSRVHEGRQRLQRYLEESHR